MQKRATRENELRALMQKNKVVVFQRDVLEPWDGVPRFDFLNCNLQAVLKDKEEFKSQHTNRKDSFIGNINQLKPQQAKKEERKDFSALEKQQNEFNRKYRAMMMIGQPKKPKIQKP